MSYTWSFLPVAWFLSDSCFPFPRFRSWGLEIQFPWISLEAPFSSTHQSVGFDVSGSAEPALVLYALGTENLPRCSHVDAIIAISEYVWV